MANYRGRGTGSFRYVWKSSSMRELERCLEEDRQNYRATGSINCVVSAALIRAELKRRNDLNALEVA